MSALTLERHARAMLDSLGLRGQPSHSDERVVAKILAVEFEREITPEEIEDVAMAMAATSDMLERGHDWLSLAQNVREHYRAHAQTAIRRHRAFLKTKYCER